MPTSFNQIVEQMQQHAKTCETAAQDSNQEALTGESNAKEKNTQDANEWMIRSKVWLEAEAIVRGFVVESPLRAVHLADTENLPMIDSNKQKI
jgi:hypothetical protein